MKTILVIEDNNDIRENTCELLEMEGYRVISAANGKKGLALAKEKKPDVILCDVIMPDANGYEVCKGLKNNRKTSYIPFVFLSASVQKKDLEIGYSLGAKAYIRKPFEPEELFGVIANCLKQ